jgi:hypothetical protein
MNVRETPEHLRVPAAHVPGADQSNPADVHVSPFRWPLQLGSTAGVTLAILRAVRLLPKIVQRTTILPKG